MFKTVVWTDFTSSVYLHDVYQLFRFLGPWRKNIYNLLPHFYKKLHFYTTKYAISTTHLKGVVSCKKFLQFSTIK